MRPLRSQEMLFKKQLLCKKKKIIQSYKNPTEDIYTQHRCLGDTESTFHLMRWSEDLLWCLEALS